MEEEKKRGRRTFIKGIAAAGVATTAFGLKPLTGFSVQQKGLEVNPAPDPNEAEDEMTPEVENLLQASLTEANDAVEQVLEEVIKSEKAPRSIDVRNELGKRGFQLKSQKARSKAKTVSLSPGLQKKREVAKEKGWHLHVCPFIWCGAMHTHVTW